MRSDIDCDLSLTLSRTFESFSETYWPSKLHTYSLCHSVGGGVSRLAPLRNAVLFGDMLAAAGQAEFGHEQSH